MKTLTLDLVGDIALLHDTAKLAQSQPERVFRGIKPLLDGDLVIGNLETPVVRDLPLDPARGTLSTDERIAEPLFELGFDAVILANNHAMDCGQMGLKHTCAALDQRGIAHFGAGPTLAQAREMLVMERNGLRVGMLAYSQPELDDAGPERAGVAPLRRAMVLADVQRCRPQVDVLLVALHEGYEFSDYPRLDFLGLCRELADAGVTVVYGNHPHVPQGYEQRGDGVIFYSMGNFLFDMPYHREHIWSRRSFVAHVTVSAGEVEAVEFRPVAMTDEGGVEPAEGEVGRAIVERVHELSQRLDDREFIAQQNAAFVKDVMYHIFRATFSHGQQGDEQGFDAYLKRQIYRDPYAKAFTDFARLVAGYQGL